MITLLLVAFILIGLFLLISVIITPNSKISRQVGEETKFSWVAPNKTWVTTKFFIICVGLLLISPKYFNFYWDTNDKLEFSRVLSGDEFLRVEFIPFETWTYTEILFIIVYICVLLFLVNIPVKYTITNKNITYGVIGYEGYSQYFWEDVVCFDVYNGQLHLWFKPPIYKPDLSISVPRGQEEDIIRFVNQFCERYSVRLNT